MSNSAEPQNSGVDDPSEAEVVSKAADKTPEKPATAVPVRVNEDSARMKRFMSYGQSSWGQVRNFRHPTYYWMMVEALLTLKKRTGSSLYAIKKSMKEKYKENLPYDFKTKTSNLVKASVKNGRLIAIKASFKLTKAGKLAAAKPKSKSKPKSKTAKPKATEPKPKPKAKTKAAEEKKATPAKRKAEAMKAPVKKKAEKMKAPAKKAEKMKAPAKKKAKKGSA